MTFAELQAELISVPAARFKETQRASVKRWINDRYAELWELEDWTFRHALVSLAIVGGNNQPVMPTDFGAPLGLWNDSGARLPYLQARDFLTLHLSATTSGTPSSFTVINSQIQLDPTPSGNATYQLHYLKDVTPLVNDGDVPALPVQHHYLLVHGATASGSVQMNDFTYQFAEQKWSNGIDNLRRNFLDEQSEETEQWGSYMETWRQ